MQAAWPGPGRRISIHAPRAGSDLQVLQVFGDVRDFNPCSPCGERRELHDVLARAREFQSMLPVRGATLLPRRLPVLLLISIHAPRAGSDTGVLAPGRKERHFNPCSPCGERQRPAADPGDPQDFNPCSPCGERPVWWRSTLKMRRNFNPCSPCGERRQNQTKYGLYFGKIAEVSDRQQQRFGMYEVKHERLERLQGHFEKFRGANGRRIF